MKPGWIVCQLSVTDEDLEPNAGPFLYDIRNSDDSNAFSIDPDGTVRTAAKLDHRFQQNYKLEIRVFDNGKPLLHSDTWLHIKVQKYIFFFRSSVLSFIFCSLNTNIVISWTFVFWSHNSKRTTCFKHLFIFLMYYDVNINFLTKKIFFVATEILIIYWRKVTIKNKALHVQKLCRVKLNESRV